VHLRRALLLFALVLGLTALAASIAPPPNRDGTSTTPPPPRPRSEPAEETSIAFSAPVRKGRPPERRVAPGTHLIVAIAAREPGEVTIPRLGRLSNVTPGVPASFDLLAPDPGRYDVLFKPTGGEPSRVGTIVSRRER
jgi:hypothetical protein